MARNRASFAFKATAQNFDKTADEHIMEHIDVQYSCVAYDKEDGIDGSSDHCQILFTPIFI